MPEDQMVAWHHWFNGHESGQALGVGDGEGGLACCTSWGCNELDTTEGLNETELTTAEFSKFAGILSAVYIYTLYVHIQWNFTQL